MRTSLKIQNLKCGGCGSTITNRLGVPQDSNDVSVNVEDSTVSFAHTLESTVEFVKQTLAQLGYPEVHYGNTLGRRAKSYISYATGKMGS